MESFCHLYRDIAKKSSGLTTAATTVKQGNHPSHWNPVKMIG